MKAGCVLAGILILTFSAGLYAQTAQELIAQADELYENLQDMETARQVLSLYRKALGVAEDKYEPFWKIARVQFLIGDHTEKKKDQKTIFAQAVYHATKAVDLQPEKPDGYYWRGVNNGKFGEVKGVLKSLSLVKPIKRDMNKVIELNRAYEQGGPDRVLGRVFFKLPGMAGGSKDKSKEHLAKSLEYGPDDALTRIYMAETLMAKKEIDNARLHLEYVLDMEDDPRWVPMVEECKRMARDMLRDKKFK